ncbi:hypothetical protein [Massilia frigida]
MLLYLLHALLNAEDL